MIIRPPTKQFCLNMAEHCFICKDEEGSWDWLIAWVFHEEYFPVCGVKR
jgi:hypothetical protein